ncbi:MAG: ABC transporter permease [Acidimicrobiales bacterium]
MSVTLVFLIPRLMPGNPLLQLEDPSSGFYLPSGLDRAHLLADYGLNHPLGYQYLQFLKGLVTGDLGWSITENTRVSTLIAQDLPWTCLLFGTALAISALVSFTAGLASGWRRGGRSDRSSMVVASVLHAMPAFVVGTLLLMAFGVVVPILPVSGGTSAFSTATGWGRILDIGRHLVLPVGTLALSLVAGQWLLVRNFTVNCLGEDWLLFARAKGVPASLQRRRHVGRNALLPFITLISLEASFAIGATIFIDSVFSYPGLGTLMLDSVNNRDYPVIDGCFLVLTAMVLVINFLVDTWYVLRVPGASRR